MNLSIAGPNRPNIAFNSILPETAYLHWLAQKRLANSERIALASQHRITRTQGVKPLPSPNTPILADVEKATEARRIVVVDDEAVVAVTLAEILIRKDFSVIWFTNPTHALDFLQSHLIDLLISDITMPEMDGLRLAELTRLIQPECPILILSAVSTDPTIVERFKSLEGSLYLAAKPISVDALICTINAIGPQGPR